MASAECLEVGDKESVVRAQPRSGGGIKPRVERASGERNPGFAMRARRAPNGADGNERLPFGGVPVDATVPPPHSGLMAFAPIPRVPLRFTRGCIPTPLRGCATFDVRRSTSPASCLLRNESANPRAVLACVSACRLRPDPRFFFRSRQALHCVPGHIHRRCYFTSPELRSG